ncbi:MAG TPA: hypothetical protein DCW90_12290 [Lachnospiraceae bacterium]|nr:hypothetical protein [Lachnospiraceae bacterium]
MRKLLLMFTVFMLWILLIILLAVKVPCFYMIMISFIAGLKIGDWADMSYEYFAKKLFKED